MHAQQSVSSKMTDEVSHLTDELNVIKCFLTKALGAFFVYRCRWQLQMVHLDDWNLNKRLSENWSWLSKPKRMKLEVWHSTEFIHVLGQLLFCFVAYIYKCVNKFRLLKNERLLFKSATILVTSDKYWTFEHLYFPSF